MKKLLALVLAACLLMTVVPAFATVADTVAASENLTHDELVEKAKAEEGTFIVYGNTSRISTAAENFSKLYDIPYESNNLKDAEIYTKLESEIKGSAKGADMVMIQDGAQLTYAIEDGWVVNYVPASVKDTVGESDRNPLVHQYINKLFIYNKLGENVPAIKNVWELTAPEMKGNIIFKNPENETVNMNFLVMLTSDAWAEKLAAAYKDWKGEEIDLGSSSVLTDNLTVAQYDASENGYTVEPFSGFMYPMYAMISANATRPYTAMLFIEYLMTQEGFQPWGKSIGAYSTSTAVTPNEGDLDITVWKDTLVMEDPEYILDNFDDVSTFAIKYIQK